MRFKFDQQGLTEAAVAGVAAGILVGCVALSARFVTDAGDVLGFFGGAFGAAAAVVGGMFLEDRKSRDRSHSGMRRVEGALANIVERSRELLNDEENLNAGQIMALSQALGIYKSTYLTFVSDDFELIAALEAFAAWCEPSQKLIGQLLAKHRADEISIEYVFNEMAHLLEGYETMIIAALKLDYGWTGKAHDRLGLELPK